ncbi:MAG: AraC family transcriptional regulator [Eubacteriales bacterium]|nr:AraC family transcriptional regulator [Eubacteriales bacterium]
MPKKNPSPLPLEYSHYNLPLNFPILGLTGDQWFLPDDEITYLHCHNCLEIGFCHRGNGELLVENKLFPFTDDDISVVCPNTMHKSKSQKGTTSDWEYVYIDTGMLFQDYLIPGYDKASLFMFDYPDFPNIISGREHPALKTLLLLILGELREKKEDFELHTACLCVSFLIELARILPKESETPFSSLKTRLAIYPAIEYIEKNYMNPIKIETLADACALSLTHFRRLFKAIMHASPLDYVNRVRVHKACELLYNTEDPVLDIALAVGFSDNTGLNRNFTRIMGCPPMKWRNRTRAVPKKNMEFSIFHT